MKETDLAEKVIEYLHHNRWKVYQEVQLWRGSKRADIVAAQGPLLWVIETKLTLSLSLIYQALQWRKDAHFVSIAIPAPGRHSNGAGNYFCRKEGIGILAVDVFRTDPVYERLRPVLFRKAHIEHIKSHLCDQQKTFAKAGNAEGKYWTPYQETCQNINAAVRLQPGIILKDLIDTVKHHYASKASATSSISHWAQGGKIKGIRCERDGRFLRFYPEECDQKEQG
ncbi:MAG: hypothetical protein V1835_05890 [Candidatus Micrarchaeota archaeon]